MIDLKNLRELRVLRGENPALKRIEKNKKRSSVVVREALVEISRFWNQW
jgi:hypothetical protein